MGVKGRQIEEERPNRTVPVPGLPGQVQGSAVERDNLSSSSVRSSPFLPFFSFLFLSPLYHLRFLNVTTFPQKLKSNPDGNGVWTNRDKFVGIVQRRWENPRQESVARWVSNREVP